MPELPEVETVKNGLEPFLSGAYIQSVELHRPNLRFPFPQDFSKTLHDLTITSLSRRAKYLLFNLSNGGVWLSHLGMTGAFTINDSPLHEPSRLNAPKLETQPDPQTGFLKHTHFTAQMLSPTHGPFILSYADPRRFGFMDYFAQGASNPFLDSLGPEPLGNQLSALYLASRFQNKKTPIKSALLDQSHIAGLGNIYVCEALHMAGIAPTRLAGSLVTPSGEPKPELDLLMLAIRKVLEDAIEAGGSTLKDFKNAEGKPGYFQHSFLVYGREDQPCQKPNCTGTIARIVQSGRSTFFCPICQS